MKRFGDPTRFAIDFAFSPDPHDGRGASPVHAASWGTLRLWVGGRNLCEYRAEGALHDAIDWYLFPLIAWLAENWDPLFHEQRFPEVVPPRNARHAYLGAVRATLGDPDPHVEHRAVAWQQWWQRHALRSCREGGLFPDTFIRRVLDFTEISWGNQDVPGAPEGFYFTAPSDTAYLAVAEVAEPLHQALEMALDHLKRGGVWGTKDVAHFGETLSRLSGTPLAEREAWYLYGRPDGTGRNGDIRHVLERSAEDAREGAKTLLGSICHTLYLEHLSPAVAMFGSASLSIDQADTSLLAHALLAAYCPEAEPAALKSLVDERPLSEMHRPHEEGYDLALDLLDALELPDPAASVVDLSVILDRLDIILGEVALEDDGVRGVALAGPDIRPTILINSSHRMNQRDSGRRFTLAHELCHVLHDRGYARRVSLISGPWAPAGIERRANAFAAMLLMPPVLVNKHLAALDTLDIVSVEAIEALAGSMGTGFLATLEHITDIGKLDQWQRDKIREARFAESGI